MIEAVDCSGTPTCGCCALGTPYLFSFWTVDRRRTHHGFALRNYGLRTNATEKSSRLEENILAAESADRTALDQLYNFYGAAVFCADFDRFDRWVTVLPKDAKITEIMAA